MVQVFSVQRQQIRIRTKNVGKAIGLSLLARNDREYPVFDCILPIQAEVYVFREKLNGRLLLHIRRGELNVEDELYLLSIFRKADLIGQVLHQKDAPSPDVLQVFWCGRVR